MQCASFLCPSSQRPNFWTAIWQKSPKLHLFHIVWLPHTLLYYISSGFRNIQLSTSSLAIHGGAIFSAVSGRKSIPISAIEAPEHGAWYRLLGFCLTITFCLIPAHQAVSYWNCHWYWRISRLGDHKYLPFVTNPYEIKQANPLTNTAISKGNGLVCWN